MIGQTISHYQILEKLGQGGMGVVYKARDTRLDRSVALKFLPTHSLPSDDDRARFLREAKAAASLSHPNICTIHEIDQTDEGQALIAMECVEGETLDAQIRRGPLKLDEAIAIAIQIAEGLQAAHEAGVIHRDIKPSNVMLTARGRVKLMDFGLAKTTAASLLTKEGTTMGTVAYMSPEQARGEAVDHRTDLWSLGVVLYEMITGRRPFAGDYEQAVIYAILNEDPAAPSGLRTGVPPALERGVAKLLMKDASLRYQSAVEIPADLKAIDMTATGTTTLMTTTRRAVPAGPPPQRALPWRVAVPAAMALVVFVALVAGSLGWMLKPAPVPQPVARFSVTLPPTEHFTRTGDHAIAFSPDGTRLVHTANGRLHLRRLDQLETSTILGTIEAISQPFFSPDGQWVAFEHVPTDRLMKIAVTGGAPVPLSEVDRLSGASWGVDDMIVYGQRTGGIWRVSAAGGTPELLIAPDSSRRDLFHGPQVLPGGKAVLFTLRPAGSASWEDAQIVVASLETGVRTVLLDGGTDARYLPTGHLVYVQEHVLVARSFDADRLAWTGSPVALGENVSQIGFSTAAQFSVSGTGSLVYIPDRPDNPGWKMVWIDHQGALTPVTEEPRRFFTPSLSPDGRQVAVQIEDPENGSDDVWIYDVGRGAPNRLTFGGSDTQPIWTPDGTRVTYSAYRNGVSDIYWRAADRSGEAELLWGDENHQYAYSWSPDGRFLTFDYLHPETNDDIWVLDMADTTASAFLNTAAYEENAMFSPDGQYLAYESDETGTVEVYVRPYPGPGAQVPISLGGGHDAMWARDGRTLYYLSGQKMMAVPVEAGPPFKAGEPEALFEGQYFISYVGGERYGVHPDGERFLMLDVESATAGEAPDAFKVVLNWFEELRQRVPADR